MKKLLILFLLGSLLAGCDSRRSELNARFVEMVSFIDQIKEKEGFLEMYSDPKAVQKEKESKHWAAMLQKVPDNILGVFRDRLTEARSMSPSFSPEGDVATYTFSNDFKLRFIKTDGQWYIYYGKQNQKAP